MRKNLVLLLFLLLSKNVYSIESSTVWEGTWVHTEMIDKSSITRIPFSSQCMGDIIIIDNENPDRPITYEVLDEYGNVLLTGTVSKENSGQIIISVSDLSDNGIYTIILTSPVPNDWVYSKFKK